jgi:hypothetical protein
MVSQNRRSLDAVMREVMAGFAGFASPQRGVALKVTEQAIDRSTASGKCFFDV